MRKSRKTGRERDPINLDLNIENQIISNSRQSSETGPLMEAGLSAIGEIEENTLI